MNAQDVDAYVRERAAPPGSTLHYCALFASPAQARLSLALEAFRRELDAVVEECREPSAAQARLGFWHDELGRLRDGRPQHPVTRVLAEAMHDHPALAERLAPAVAATAAASSRLSWASESQLDDYCAATGGEVAALACGTAPVSDEPHAPSRRLGALLCRQEMLTGLFGQPRRCAQALTEEALAARGIALGDVFRDPPGAAADALLREEAARLHDGLRALLADAPAGDEGERLLRARAAVSVATLSAARRGGAAWLARHASVSPLRKLWIAWRHGR